MLANTITTSTNNLKWNKIPASPLSAAFAAIWNRPPSSVPAGQIYLQKNGDPTPVSSTRKAGRRITIKIRIKYLIYLAGRSIFAGTLYFGSGILCSRSCTSPNGHSSPQTTRPKTTPNSIISQDIERDGMPPAKGCLKCPNRAGSKRPRTGIAV